MLEARATPHGASRVRFETGWASITANTGQKTFLVEVLQASQPTRRKEQSMVSEVGTLMTVLRVSARFKRGIKVCPLEFSADAQRTICHDPPK